MYEVSPIITEWRKEFKWLYDVPSGQKNVHLTKINSAPKNGYLKF
jgi:hypothetical protein